MQYGIFTMVGNKKTLAIVRNTLEEAQEMAFVLTDSASSNPRNPTPAHWVEEL